MDHMEATAIHTIWTVGLDASGGPIARPTATLGSLAYCQDRCRQLARGVLMASECYDTEADVLDSLDLVMDELVDGEWADYFAHIERPVDWTAIYDGQHPSSILVIVPTETL